MCLIVLSLLNTDTMNDLRRQNEELVNLLDKAMEIASDAILPQGIFIRQRYSRLKEAVRQFKQRQSASNNTVESKE